MRVTGPQLRLSPMRAREHLASLVSDRVGGRHPRVPGREHGQAKGEVMGTADWTDRACPVRGASHSQLPFIPAIWKQGILF